MKKGRSHRAQEPEDDVVGTPETGSGASRVGFWLPPVCGEGLTWLSMGASKTARRFHGARETGTESMPRAGPQVDTPPARINRNVLAFGSLAIGRNHR